MRVRLRAGALAAAAALLAGGCGAPPGGGQQAGAPITVMTWAPQHTAATNLPGMPAIAEAYARMVNAQGGLDGHPLNVLTCDEGNSPVQAGRCAQQAVDAHAVAVVGSYSQYGQSFMPTLEFAGIPYIGGYGITPQEFTNLDSYPVNGGAPALLAGSGRQMAEECTRTALVRPDTAAGDQFPEFLDAGLATGHRPPAVDIRVRDDAGEYTAAARRAIGDGRPGQCVTAVLGSHTGIFFDSFRRLLAPGEQVRTWSVIGSLQQSLIDQTGGAQSPMEGSRTTGWYPPPDDPRWKPMQAAIARYAFGDNRIDPADPGAETTWIAYTVLSEVVRSLGSGPITATTVLHALNQARGIRTGGLTPPLDWRDAGLPASRRYPRMVNATVTYQMVQGGRLTAAGSGGFVDLGGILQQVGG